MFLQNMEKNIILSFQFINVITRKYIVENA